MSKEADCRTAPATPGLFKMLSHIFCVLFLLLQNQLGQFCFLEIFFLLQFLCFFLFCFCYNLFYQNLLTKSAHKKKSSKFCGHNLLLSQKNANVIFLSQLTIFGKIFPCEKKSQKHKTFVSYFFFITSLYVQKKFCHTQIGVKKLFQSTYFVCLFFKVCCRQIYRGIFSCMEQLQKSSSLLVGDFVKKFICQNERVTFETLQ